jgi:NAD(P)-dependent dehydrogenase (short-subunit alcohol dehydrogenase family)
MGRVCEFRERRCGHHRRHHARGGADAEAISRGRQAMVVNDVTSGEQVKEMVDATVAALGRWTSWSSPARWSESRAGTNLSLSEDAWDRWSTSTSGRLLCAEQSSYMKANGYGKIVNISSLGAISPPRLIRTTRRRQALGPTYDMAAELGPHGIYERHHADLSAPRSSRDRGGRAPKNSFHLHRQPSALGRMGEPDDIAKALFLASDLSSPSARSSRSRGLPLPPALGPAIARCIRR